jgi:hypothetical protein
MSDGTCMALVNRDLQYSGGKPQNKIIHDVYIELMYCYGDIMKRKGKI